MGQIASAYIEIAEESFRLAPFASAAHPRFLEWRQLGRCLGPRASPGFTAASVCRNPLTKGNNQLYRNFRRLKTNMQRSQKILLTSIPGSNSPHRLMAAILSLLVL